MKKAVIIGSASLLNSKIQTVLQKSGFHKAEVVKNLDNLSIKRHDWRDVECFVIDLDNADHDMIAVIKELKENDTSKDVPILSLSSNAELKTLKRAIAAGCSEFLVKPFELSVLLQRIYKICKKEIGFDSKEPEKAEKEAELMSITEESTYENVVQKELVNDSQGVDEAGYTIKWIHDFMIGVPQIDQEHEEIILNFNKLYLLMKAGKGHEYYDELLQFLKKYVTTHFAHEEQIQLELNYPGYEKHKILHQEFYRKVLEMEQSHQGGFTTDRELIYISLYVRDWLYHHILLEDVQIGAYVNTRK